MNNADDEIRLHLSLDETSIGTVESRVRQIVNQLGNQRLNITANLNGVNTAIKSLERLQERVRELQNATINISANANVLTPQQQQYRLETVAQRLSIEREKTAQSENKAVQALAQENRTLTRNYNINQQISGTIDHQHRRIQDLNNQTNNLTRILSRGIAAYAGYKMINAMYSSLTNAFDEMKKIDSEMTEIYKVVDLTADGFERLEKSSYKIGQKYARSGSEYLKSVAAFSKAGYGERSAQLGELALLAQNSADMDADLSNQFLVSADAAWKYKGNVQELTKILDGFNLLSDKTAAKAPELASGLTVVGSLFAQAGLSAQDYASLVGTAEAKTQLSGNQIARAFRQIVANLRQIKDVQDLETGEILSDDASLSKAEEALNSVGISIREVKDGITELRNPMEILKELSSVWGDLSSIQKSYIQEGVSNKRNSNIFASVMENWEDVEKAAVIYANASGSALRENEIYLQSYEARVSRLQATWTSYISNVADMDTIKDSIEFLTGVVNLLDTSVGHVVTQAVLLVTTLNLASRAMQGLVARNIYAQIIQLGIAEGSLGTAIQMVTADIIEQSAAFAASPLGILAITIMSVVAAVKIYDTALQHSYKVAQQQAEASQELIDKYDEEISSLEDLQSRLQDAQGDKNALAQISSELNGVIGETPGLINGEAKAYETANVALEKRLEYLRKVRAEEEKSKIAAVKQEFNSATVDRWGLNISASAMRTEARQLQEGREKWLPKAREDVLKNSQNANLSPEEIDKAIEDMLDLYIAAYVPRSSSEEQFNKFFEDEFELAKEALDNTLSSYEGSGGRSFLEQILHKLVFTGSDMDEIEKIIRDIASKGVDLNDAEKEYLESLTNEGADSEEKLKVVSGLLDELKEKYPQLTSVLEDYYTVISSGNEEVQKQTDETTNSLSTLSAMLSDVAGGDKQKNIKALANAYKDMAQNSVLSIDTVSDLLEQYPELEDKIITTADGYKIEKSSIEEVIDAMLEKYRLEIEQSEQSIITQANTLEEAGKLDIEREKYDSLSEAIYNAVKMKLALISTPEYAVGKNFDTWQSDYKQYSEMLQTMDEIRERRESLDSLKGSLYEDIFGAGEKTIRDNGKKYKDYTKKISDLDKKVSLDKTKYELDTTALSIERIDNAVKALEQTLDLTADDDYITRITTTSQQLDLARQKASMLSAEFSQLQSEEYNSASAAKELADRMQSVTDEIAENQKNIIEYGKNIAQYYGDALKAVGTLSKTQIDEASNLLDRNIKSLEEGGLIGLSFSLSPVATPKSAIEKQRKENKSLEKEMQRYYDAVNEMQKIALDMQYQETVEENARQREELNKSLSEIQTAIDNAGDETKGTITEVENTYEQNLDDANLSTQIFADSINSTFDGIGQRVDDVSGKVRGLKDAIDELNDISIDPKTGAYSGNPTLDAAPSAQQQYAYSDRDIKDTLTKTIPKGSIVVGTNKTYNGLPVRASYDETSGSYMGYINYDNKWYSIGRQLKESSLVNEKYGSLKASDVAKLKYAAQSIPYVKNGTMLNAEDSKGRKIFYLWDDKEHQYKFFVKDKDQWSFEPYSPPINQKLRGANGELLNAKGGITSGTTIVNDGKGSLAGREGYIGKDGRLHWFKDEKNIMFDTDDVVRIISAPDMEQILKYTGNKYFNEPIGDLNSVTAYANGNTNVTFSALPQVNYNPSGQTNGFAEQKSELIENLKELKAILLSHNSDVQKIETDADKKTLEGDKKSNKERQAETQQFSNLEEKIVTDLNKWLKTNPIVAPPLDTTSWEGLVSKAEEYSKRIQDAFSGNGNWGTGRDAIIKAARSQIGYAPGINASNKFSGWMNGVANYAQAWCADFASWALSKAGITGIKSSSVAGLRSQTRATSTPQIGDLAMKNNDHVEIVSGINPDGTVRTIGGNTGKGEVKEHTRTDWTDFRTFSTGTGKFSYDGIAGETYETEYIIDKKTGAVTEIDSPTLVDTDKQEVVGVEQSKKIKKHQYKKGTIPVPNGLGKEYTYMAWDTITNMDTEEGHLIKTFGKNYDSEGYGKIGDRYALAMTSTFGNIGDAVDVYMSDGRIIRGVLAEEKSQVVTPWDKSPANEWGHKNGDRVVEWVTNWTNHDNPESNGSVLKVENLGSVFDNSDLASISDNISSIAQDTAKIATPNFKEQLRAITDKDIPTSQRTQFEGNLLEYIKENTDIQADIDNELLSSWSKLQAYNTEQKENFRGYEQQLLDLVGSDGFVEYRTQLSQTTDSYLKELMREQTDITVKGIKQSFEQAKDIQDTILAYYYKRESEGATADELKVIRESWETQAETVQSLSDSYVSAISSYTDYVVAMADLEMRAYDERALWQSKINDDLERELNRTEDSGKRADIINKILDGYEKQNDIYETAKTAAHNGVLALYDNENYTPIFREFDLESWFDAQADFTAQFENDLSRIAITAPELVPIMNEIAKRVQTYKKEWLEADEAIKSNEDSIYNLNKTLTSGKIERYTKNLERLNSIDDVRMSKENALAAAMEKRNSIMQSMRKELADIKAEVDASMHTEQYLDEDTRKLIYNTEDYEKQRKDIENIQAETERLYKHYQKDLASLNETEYYKESQITDEYNKQLDALNEKLAVSKQQLENTKKQLAYENGLKERDTRIIVGGHAVMVADPDRMYNLAKERSQAESELQNTLLTNSENENVRDTQRIAESIHQEIAAREKMVDLIGKMSDSEAELFSKMLPAIEELELFGNMLSEINVPWLNAHSREYREQFADLPSIYKVNGYNLSYDYHAGHDIVSELSSSGIISDEIARAYDKQLESQHNLKASTDLNTAQYPTTSMYGGKQYSGKYAMNDDEILKAHRDNTVSDYAAEIAEIIRQSGGNPSNREQERLRLLETLRNRKIFLEGLDYEQSDRYGGIKFLNKQTDYAEALSYIEKYAKEGLEKADLRRVNEQMNRWEQLRKEKLDKLNETGEWNKENLDTVVSTMEGDGVPIEDGAIVEVGNADEIGQAVGSNINVNVSADSGGKSSSSTTSQPKQKAGEIARGDYSKTGYTTSDKLKVNKYANGTDDAKPGWALTDEEGYEFKLKKLGGQFRELEGHEKIFTADMTENLKNFSMNPPNYIQDMIDKTNTQMMNVVTNTDNRKSETHNHYDFGGVVVEHPVDADGLVNGLVQKASSRYDVTKSIRN